MKNKCFLMTAIILISVAVVLMPFITKADIHVYDKNNQYLGILMEMGEQNGGDLFIPSLGGFFTFNKDLESCGREEILFFVGDNCTGTPYSEHPNPVIFDLGNCQIAGFYKRDYNGRQTFTPGSYYWYNVDTSETICRTNDGNYPPSAEYYPYVQVQIPFTIPFARPLRFEVETQTVTQTEIMPFPIVVTPKNQ